MDDDSIIKAHELTKRFGATVALDRVTLTVARGEVFGFLGPNGAGKTTMVRLLLGLLRPTSGSVAIFGRDATTDAVAVHRRIAYVPGELSLWPQLTGGETLELLGALHGSVEAPFRDELCRRFDFDTSKRNRSYSKGNRQKIALIAALMVRAELLVLDEPTSGLDPLMERTFRECVAEAVTNGQTVFLSSHILSEVEALCGRVGILRAGRLVDVGTLADMRHLRARTVELQIPAPMPDLSGVAGVRNVVIDGDRVRLEVQGSMAPLLDALSGHEVVGFDSREPSLEEIFVSHYDGSQQAPSAEPVEHT